MSQEMTFKPYFDTGYEISTSGVIRKIRDESIVPTSIIRDVLSVQLWIDKKSITKYPHRMVGEIFLENPDKHPMVLHVDGDGCNPDISNLKWGTRSDKSKMAYERGRILTLSTDKGEDHYLAEVADSQVSRAIQLYDTGKYTFKQLGELFGVSRSTVHKWYTGVNRGKKT
ncbi:HNH endonuclease [Vibrio phage D148]